MKKEKKHSNYGPQMGNVRDRDRVRDYDRDDRADRFRDYRQDRQRENYIFFSRDLRQESMVKIRREPAGSRSRSRSPSPPLPKPKLHQMEEKSVLDGLSINLLQITGLQAANGSWKFFHVKPILGINKDLVEWLYTIDKSSVDNIDDLLATCLFIAYIQYKFPKEQEIWKMVVHKARLFIINTLSKQLAKAEAVRSTSLLIDSGTNYLIKNK